MGAYGQVSLPENDVVAEPTQPFYPVGGGANGTIALPNRQVADSQVAPKYAAGAVGALPGFRPSISRNNPFKLFDGLSGWFAVFRTRYFQANATPVARFAPTQSGTTAWTDNRPTGSGAPRDAVRMFSRYEDTNLNEEFDTRLQAIYWPRDVIQRGTYINVAAGSNEKMIPAFFNRLTQYRQSPSYSSLTQVLGDEPTNG